MSHLNRTQRAGIFVGTVILVCLVIFHSPWHGYFEVGESFFDWTSKKPLILWFSEVANVVASIAGVSALTGAFVYLFKSP